MFWCDINRSLLWLSGDISNQHITEDTHTVHVFIFFAIVCMLYTSIHVQTWAKLGKVKKPRRDAKNQRIRGLGVKFRGPR